jgi:Protein of unknown function (DUF3606)
MADDKSIKSPTDPHRVNLDKDDDVQYWTSKFDCSAEQLKAAVRLAGPRVAAVAKKLGKSHPG